MKSCFWLNIADNQCAIDDRLDCFIFICLIMSSILIIRFKVVLMIYSNIYYFDRAIWVQLCILGFLQGLTTAILGPGCFLYSRCESFCCHDEGKVQNKKIFAIAHFVCVKVRVYKGCCLSSEPSNIAQLSYKKKLLFRTFKEYSTLHAFLHTWNPFL